MSPARRAGLKRLAILLGATMLVMIIAVVWVMSRNGDVVNSDVEFTAPPPKKTVQIRPETFVWPLYGYRPTRTRALAADIKPPFRPLWRFNANQLLEFSPILVRGTLYVIRKDATVFAIDARTGRRKWARKVGKLSASSPAYANGRIFVSTLSGRVLALNASKGKVRWARTLGSRTESSPLVLGDSVVVGSEDGTLYRMSQKTGRIRWGYHAGGAIKGAPAYANGKIFVGAYGGTVHAVHAPNGRPAWVSSTKGARFGFGSGNFYATPAVAYGRVFVGNTDGKVYAFAASNGRLAWSKTTSAFVYAAAAVDNVAGIGPTVFVGSYDGTFYALNARNGSIRWTFRSGGQISGAATVVGDLVYYSDLRTTDTYGLSVRSGRKRFYRNSGAYNPVISDGRRLFLTGYESIAAYVQRKDYREERKQLRAALKARR